MPEADVPDQPLLYIGAGDMRTWGQMSPPSNYVSYRVTTDSSSVVYDAFKGCKVVIAEEVSKSGVQHYHVVMEGHDNHEVVKKRLTRAKLGVNKWWSKKNSGDFGRLLATRLSVAIMLHGKDFMSIRSTWKASIRGCLVRARSSAPKQSETLIRIGC